MPSATLYQITGRFRAREFMPVSLADFSTDAGRSVDAAILNDPRWSLYGLDLDRDDAIFVHLAGDTDLSAAPFITTAQFTAAGQVLTVPLDALPALAEPQPRPKKLIFLFSIGRCGTTLANHILNTVPGVLALSEPRSFVTLAMARASLPPDRARALIGAVTRFMFRPAPGPAKTAFAIKFHAQVLFQAEPYWQLFPQARFLFMYRDAKGWANSQSQFQQNLGTPLQMDLERLRRTWSIMVGTDPARLARSLDLSAPTFAHPPLMALIWDAHIREYLRLRALGLPFHALRYDDLTARREASIRALLAHCGLPDENLSPALATFDRDSQEGTAIQRGGHVTPFTEADRAEVAATLAREPDPIPWDLRF